jgi:PAS domain S-box-containing protein
MTPIKDGAGRVVKFVGVQVDVSNTTEGLNATYDAQGVPLLVKYDDRLKETVAKPVVDDVLHALQVEEGKEPKRLSRAEVKGKPPPRVALDLATTVERIQSNFVISDPTLPDCPIVFSSDAFLTLTQYRREEVLGRNCRFLQGIDTDKSSVDELKDAIKRGEEITVRLLNYKKDGTPFWNMLTVAPIKDSSGQPRFLVGVQVDVTAHPTELESDLKHSVTAVNAALKEQMSWVGVDPWASFPTGLAPPKPHHASDPKFAVLKALVAKEGRLRLRHLQRVRQLGSGDVGMVDLVQLGPKALELAGVVLDPNDEEAAAKTYRFALKSLEKREMVERNKIGRVRTEAKILGCIDHPFLATLYATLQTDTHLHFLLEYCGGGELFAHLNSQPRKCFTEEAVKFYASEVLIALQYLHLQGFVYRDLKPENILLHSNGHIMVTDFDLSFAQGTTTPTLLAASPSPSTSSAAMAPTTPSSSKNGTTTCSSGNSNSNRPSNSSSTTSALSSSGQPRRSSSSSGHPRRNDYILVAQPEARANSFVGTEEYLAPEVIMGTGHTFIVDWWSFGILLYELLFGISPFRGSRRDKTFENIMKQPLVFPDDDDYSNNNNNNNNGGQEVISPACKDLIKQLLIKDPKKRLGSVAGAEDIKRHAWFKGINWALLRNEEAPLAPQRRTSTSSRADTVTSAGSV